jgi:hypothetical protein
MPRPERPVDPSWPLASFANGLRALRRERGIKYRQMSRRTNYCVSALAGAASGRYLPTWEVTRAFVTACDGPVEQWRERWHAARVTVRPQNGPARG